MQNWLLLALAGALTGCRSGTGSYLVQGALTMLIALLVLSQARVADCLHYRGVVVFDSTINSWAGLKGARVMHCQA